MSIGYADFLACVEVFGYDVAVERAGEARFASYSEVGGGTVAFGGEGFCPGCGRSAYGAGERCSSCGAEVPAFDRGIAREPLAVV